MLCALKTHAQMCRGQGFKGCGHDAPAQQGLGYSSGFCGRPEDRRHAGLTFRRQWSFRSSSAVAHCASLLLQGGNDLGGGWLGASLQNTARQGRETTRLRCERPCGLNFLQLQQSFLGIDMVSFVCSRVEDLGGGWQGVSLQTRRTVDELPRPGDAVVITRGRPPASNPLDFVTRRLAQGAGGRG